MGIERKIATLETDTATEIQRSKHKISSLGNWEEGCTVYTVPKIFLFSQI